MKESAVDIHKWTNSILEKIIQYFEKESIQTTVRSKVIDPILNHILKRIFPYIILICVMFALLLVSVLITLGVIVFQMRAAHVPSIGVLSKSL
jgi:hypothetical protein